MGDVIFEYIKHDLSNMIPLQSAKYRKNEFLAQLSGAAFAGDQEYEVKTQTRFNLGNNIYRHCPVFVCDVDGRRVRIQAPKPSQTVSSITR